MILARDDESLVWGGTGFVCPQLDAWWCHSQRWERVQEKHPTGYIKSGILDILTLCFLLRVQRREVK